MGTDNNCELVELFQKFVEIQGCYFSQGIANSILVCHVRPSNLSDVKTISLESAGGGGGGAGWGLKTPTHPDLPLSILIRYKLRLS